MATRDFFWYNQWHLNTNTSKKRAIVVSSCIRYQVGGSLERKYAACSSLLCRVLAQYPYTGL